MMWRTMPTLLKSSFLGAIITNLWRLFFNKIHFIITSNFYLCISVIFIYLHQINLSKTLICR